MTKYTGNYCLRTDVHAKRYNQLFNFSLDIIVPNLTSTVVGLPLQHM